MRSLDDGSGVLIFTDIYGGTPSNVATRLLTPNKIEGEIAREEQRVLDDESLSEEDRQEQLAVLDDLRFHAEDYHRLVRQEVAASQRLGELGGLAYALDPQLHPGAVQLGRVGGQFERHGVEQDLVVVRVHIVDRLAGVVGVAAR